MRVNFQRSADVRVSRELLRHVDIYTAFGTARHERVPQIVQTVFGAKAVKCVRNVGFVIRKHKHTSARCFALFFECGGKLGQYVHNAVTAFRLRTRDMYAAQVKVYIRPFERQRFRPPRARQQAEFEKVRIVAIGKI